MDERRLSPRATAWVGTLCALMGLAILLMALRIIPTDESKFHAPHWVVGAAGLAFFLAGVTILTGPPPGAPEAARTTWRSFLLGLGIVGALASVFNWVAFGPGSRSFSGGISIPCVSVSGPSSEWSGRVAFGAGAVLIDAFALLVMVRGLRDLLGRGR